MNNFISITLGGQLRRLKFNQGALEVYVRSLNANMVASSIIYATIYAGLIGNCYVTKTDPDFTFEQVCDWCDGADPDDLTKASNLFGETLQYKKWLEQLTNDINEEAKKKAMMSNGQTSTNSLLED